MIPSQPCQQWQPDGPDLLESLKANRQLHHALGHDLIYWDAQKSVKYV